MRGRFSDNNVSFSKTKFYTVNGVEHRIVAKVSINDDCNNGIFDFSVTVNIDYKSNNSRFVLCRCGRIDDEIVEHFPDLKIFVELTNCNIHGYSTYIIENGLYYIKNNDMENAKKCLCVTDEELSQITPYYDYPEYVKYLLFTMGVLERCQAKANIAIALAEQIAGKKFVNPYSIEEERFTIKPYTADELADIKAKIENGYYTAVEVEKHNLEKLAKERAEKENKILDEYNNMLKKAEYIRDIKLYMLDFNSDNWILYDHRKEIQFNWLSYHPTVTKETWEEYTKTHPIPKDLEFTVSFEKK